MGVNRKVLVHRVLFLTLAGKALIIGGGFKDYAKLSPVEKY